ncbi:MAG TPA: Ig-like domain-containing protein, partial [Mobilitalea sp.]|nr:Ig-like domain-containing protein [Mobilitalea sp.]
MKKRLLNKVLTILMVAAFIFSDNGIATLSASAAEKEILVEGVYTTFQKATLVSGTTKQIVTYTEPRNATDQKMFFESSNEKVARVSSSGLVTAVAPGAATITVTARDGSGQTETVKISVLNNLTITSKNVDKDNEII